MQFRESDLRARNDSWDFRTVSGKSTTMLAEKV